MSENMPTSTEPPAHLERLDPRARADHQAAQHWARYEWACRFLPAGRVLDCACGIGYGSALLAHRGAAQVTGVDISPEALAVANQSFASSIVRFIQADATDPRAELGGPFDLIVSLETIEHVPEPRRLLDNFRKMLAPGGTLAISCPNDAGLGVENPYHVWRAELAELRRWLAERFTHVSCYAEVHTLGAAIWPAEWIAQSAAEPVLHMQSVRRIDHRPLDAACGFLFACADRPLPTVDPIAADLLNGDGYLRELEQIRDRLWAEASQLGRGWQQQKDYIGHVEQAVCNAQAEAQRLATGWQQQKDYIDNLERERHTLRHQVERYRLALEQLNSRRIVRWMKQLGLLRLPDDDRRPPSST